MRQGCLMIERIGLGASSYPFPRYNNDINAASAMVQNSPVEKGPAKVNSSEENGMVSDRMLKQQGLKECETCNNRKYQDGSDDPGVSMKAPTQVDPKDAASAVTSHEQEHVVREQAKASEEGREVVMQTVQIHSAICPECGRVYVSGGETTTVTKKKSEFDDEKNRIGKILDTYV